MTCGETQSLIRAAQRGEGWAFEALMRGHYHGMYKMAYKWCGQRDAAQDIVQDACIKVVRGLGGFRFESSFSSWLYRIVINTARDYHKRNRDLARDDLDEWCEPQTATGGGDAERRLYARQVLRQVQHLPEREKTALLLVFGEGMTHKEAAVVMECKEGTVSAYIHAARKKLVAFAGGDGGAVRRE